MEVGHPITGTHLDLPGQAQAGRVGLGKGGTHGVKLIGYHPAAPGQCYQIAANPTAQVQYGAWRRVAVKPGGMLLRDLPCRRLFQGFSREKELFRLGKLGCGAAAQACQGYKRACPAGVESLAQPVEQRGQVGIVELGVLQLFCSRLAPPVTGETRLLPDRWR